jgi:hypothetical protein
VETGPRQFPEELKLLVAAIAVPAVVDAVFGHSTPQLVIARLALLAGVLRGVEALRQLLRVATIFTLFGSSLIVLTDGSWVVAAVEFVGAIAAYVLLGSSALRSWCGALPQGLSGRPLEEASIVEDPKPGVRYPCPCCDCLTLDERGGFEICPVCFWEDDGQVSADADSVRGGPNGSFSLAQGRANFARLGACEERFVQKVREPDASEVP